MGNFVDVTYDAQSLAEILNLKKFSSMLDEEMAPAMLRIGEIVVRAAVANTWTVFKHPTGQLADSIIAIPNGPLEIDIGSNLGYARRLEEGFHGTDSLGRSYNQEGEPYLMPALEENTDEIIAIMQEAAAITVERVAMR